VLVLEVHPVKDRQLLRPGEAVQAAKSAVASATVDVGVALAWREFTVPTFSEIHAAVRAALRAEVRELAESR